MATEQVRLCCRRAFLPALQLGAFSQREAELGVIGAEIGYIECLFKGEGDWTRPSMDFSITLEDAGSVDALITFANDAAIKADAQAKAEGSRAVFEVG